MNNRLILIIAVFLSTCSLGHGASPVYSEFTVDTSIYDRKVNFWYVPDPYVRGAGPNSPVDAIKGEMAVCGYLRKNSDQVDLYSYTGICGNLIIPNIHEEHYSIIYCSRRLIDDDAEWETIVNLPTSMFKLFDNDGTILLSDRGDAYFGFDGQNTYVVSGSMYTSQPSIRSWRFRTNISAAAPALRKSTAATAQPMTIYGPTNDNLRIKLIPTGSNQTTVQLFDLMGRCLFSKQVGKLTSPVIFTVPEGNVPQSPFITRVENDDGAYLKKRLPVE